MPDSDATSLPLKDRITDRLLRLVDQYSNWQGPDCRDVTDEILAMVAEQSQGEATAHEMEFSGRFGSPDAVALASDRDAGRRLEAQPQDRKIVPLASMDVANLRNIADHLTNEGAAEYLYSVAETIDAVLAAQSEDDRPSYTFTGYNDRASTVRVGDPRPQFHGEAVQANDDVEKIASYLERRSLDYPDDTFLRFLEDATTPEGIAGRTLRKMLPQLAKEIREGKHRDAN